MKNVIKKLLTDPARKSCTLRGTGYTSAGGDYCVYLKIVSDFAKVLKKHNINVIAVIVSTTNKLSA